MGPQTRFGENIHATKYRQPGESFRDAMGRIAGALKDSPAHYHEFRDILLDQRFCPGGRIQAAIGSTKEVTAYNCFVSGTIEDSYTAGGRGDGSIMDRAWDAAATLRLGGGIGYDFSTLRPRGDMVRKLQSHATGPVSFMSIYDAVCRNVASSGHRRGAQMGVLRIDHPDVFEFVNAKHDQQTLSGFNMSVAVTDEFMEALAAGRSFDLKFGGEVYRSIDPAELWESLMRSTWDWAEPGVLFIDTINRMNNLYYCETIAATNPCGEQPLPPFGACLLGSFNLVKYLSRQPVAVDDIRVGRGFGYAFDFDLFRADIAPVVRAMDNVVDRTQYPLEAQKREAQSKRRMGLGVMGLANAGEALGYAYGTPAFVAFTETVLGVLANESYRASAALAAEKGAFPLYDREKFLAGQFVATLDEDVRDAIGRTGVRNSHLTSLAPTGTISQAADNVTGGIEPAFMLKTKMTVNMPEGIQEVVVQDYGLRYLGVKGRTTEEVTVDEHLAVLIASANRVDSAVSKTCNLTGSTPWETFKSIYSRAWEGGAKGCTTFNKDGKRFGVREAAEDEPSTETGPVSVEGSCSFDPLTGRRDCA